MFKKNLNCVLTRTTIGFLGRISVLKMKISDLKNTDTNKTNIASIEYR